MIKINGEVVNIEHFPDGTLLLKEDVEYDFETNREADVTWLFENNEELVTLIYITKHLKSHGVEYVNLYMPYIPNARQDRTKLQEDVFTLKYFAEVVNWLGFNSVTVLDPHSSVSEALIDKLIVKQPTEYIGKVIQKIGMRNLVLYFPDAGAAKRYSDLFPEIPYCYGEKKRDWKTGKILGLDIRTNGIDLSDKAVLMIDDIIAYGGSLHYSTLALKELGVKEIYAYATHTENSILDKEKGTLIKDLENNTVQRLFTTNSLFRGEHEKITVMEV